MDRKQYTKSAPSMGRRASKEVSKKQTTLREITNWIDKGDSSQVSIKGSRNVGMLTENVTEQRLLYTRQLELGRERYKFLTSHTYEKTKFVELQNRKAKSMKKMMNNARRIIETTHSKPNTPRRSITVRIPQVEEIRDTASGEHGEDETLPVQKEEHVHPPPITEKHQETRPSSFAPEEKKSVHFPEPVRSGKKPVISGRAVYIDLTGTSIEARRSPEHEKTIERLPLLPKNKNKQLHFNSRITSASSKKSCATSIPTDKNDKNVAVSLDTALSTKQENTDVEKERISKWRLRSRPKFTQYGHKFNSSVGDPRYVALTNTLVPCDDLGKPIISVDDIIAKKEVLRGESKCERNTRARTLHARFIAYILEQELKN